MGRKEAGFAFGVILSELVSLEAVLPAHEMGMLLVGAALRGRHSSPSGVSGHPARLTILVCCGAQQ
jgi:hypothetical protein